MNFVTDEKPTSPGASGCCKLSACMGGGGGGGGGNFHYKGIYRRAARMGYTFHVSKYMNGYYFHFKRISMIFFTQEVYEWEQFLLLEVNEWVCFLTSPSI